MDALPDSIRKMFEAVEREEAELHHYQRELVVFMKANPYALLMVDLGLGKTVSSLTVISSILSEFDGRKVLVVAPIKVACETWPTELRKWRHTAWMNFTVIRVADDDPRIKEAKAEDRRALKLLGKGMGKSFETMAREKIMEELTRDPSSLHIINREALDWLVDYWRGDWPYKVVFIDESSSFKDHTTTRFTQLKKVINSNLIESLYELTATPCAESYIGLWAQVYLLDAGKRLGKSVTKFRESYFTYNHYSRKYTLKPGADEVILAKIADICLVMKKKDYLPGIEPQIIPRRVTLSDTELARTKKFERELVLTLPDGKEIEAKTAAILSSMLLQMASGTVYETTYVQQDWEDDLKKVKKVHHLHDHKLDSLKELYEQCKEQGEPLLVAYYFKSTLTRLQKAFPEGVTLDKAGTQTKKWNAGKIPIMFIHPMSAGHGMNFQYGGHILVFFDLIYSLEYYLQTVGRLDRQGQRFQVLIYIMIATKTRDELAFKSLSAKQDAQEKFFALISRLIAKYRKEKAAKEAADMEEVW